MKAKDTFLFTYVITQNPILTSGLDSGFARYITIVNLLIFPSLVIFFVPAVMWWDIKMHIYRVSINSNTKCMIWLNVHSLYI